MNVFNGAKAPTSPGVGSNLVTEPTFDMIEWYYKTPETIFIDYYQIDDSVSVVNIIVKKDNIKKMMSITIGNKIKREIIKNYNFYHK